MREQGWAGVRLARENQAHPAEAPPREHSKLMCCREHALNRTAGLAPRAASAPAQPSLPEMLAQVPGLLRLTALVQLRLLFASHCQFWV